MPLTELDLWISHIRLFDSSHVTRTSRTGTVLLHLPVPARAYDGAPFRVSTKLGLLLADNRKEVL
jgi:hypothetical protein